MKHLIFLLIAMVGICTAGTAQTDTTITKQQFTQLSVSGPDVIRNDRRLPTRKVKALFKDVPAALPPFRESKEYKTLGNITGITGGLMIGFQLVNYLAYQKVNIYFACGGVALVLADFAFYAAANNCVVRAVDIYNGAYGKFGTKLKINCVYTGTGIALCMKF